MPIDFLTSLYYLSLLFLSLNAASILYLAASKGMLPPADFKKVATFAPVYFIGAQAIGFGFISLLPTVLQNLYLFIDYFFLVLYLAAFVLVVLQLWKWQTKKADSVLQPSLLHLVVFLLILSQSLKGPLSSVGLFSDIATMLLAPIVALLSACLLLWLGVKIWKWWKKRASWGEASNQALVSVLLALTLWVLFSVVRKWFSYQ